MSPEERPINSLIAFANGAGGELILGVDNKSKDIVGIENSL
ncbi:MAG: ATP-binding protein [Proteobacteria bacterium]|nr:ATP-binding protein [Pseudomonadota bacterium]